MLISSESFYLSVAALKLGYDLLIFPQIADMKGYPIAEAYLRAGNCKDDESTKRLELAEKLVSNDRTRVKRGPDDYTPPGGYGRGRAVVPVVAMLVAGMAMALGLRMAAGRALMPMVMVPLRVMVIRQGMALLMCQQHPTCLLAPSWFLLAWAQLRL